MKKQVIFDTAFWMDDEAMEELLETHCECTGESMDSISVEMKWFLVGERNNSDKDALIELFDRVPGHKFILLGSVGTWHGACSGYKVIDKLSDIFNVCYNEMSITIVNNARLDIAYHDHDGSTYMSAYIIKDNISFVQEESLLEAAYTGSMNNSLLYRCCKSAGKAIMNLK